MDALNRHSGNLTTEGKKYDTRIIVSQYTGTTGHWIEIEFCGRRVYGIYSNGHGNHSPSLIKNLYKSKSLT